VWSATINPTSAVVGTPVSYTITVTNLSTAGETMGSVGVAIPTGAGTPTSISVVATDPGPLTRTWSVDSSPPAGLMRFSRLGASANNIDPSGTVVIQFTATATTVGSKEWTTTAYNNNNYTQPFSTLSGTQPAVTVNPAVAATTLNVSLATGTYGGTTTLSATLTQTSGGTAVSGKSISFTLNGNSVGSAVTNASGVATLSGATLAGINATTYPTGVGASFAGDSGFASSSGSATLTVNQRPITVKTNAVSRVYGDSTPAFSFSVTVGTLASGDTLASLGTASFSTDPNPGVGPHAITVSGLSNANYTITYDNTGILTVTPRPITIKANAVSRVYGDSTPAFSISLSVGTLGYSDTLASLGTASFNTDPNPGV